MDTVNPIEIRIEYETNAGQTAEVDLVPREYFDEEAITAEAALDVDSEPLHYDSADYLDVPASELKWVKLTLRNRDAERTLTFHTAYWNAGRNQLTSKTDWNEGVITEEAITFSLVTSDSPSVNHVIRAVSEGGVLRPSYHRVFTALESGENEETIL